MDITETSPPPITKDTDNAIPLKCGEALMLSVGISNHLNWSKRVRKLQDKRKICLLNVSRYVSGHSVRSGCHKILFNVKVTAKHVYLVYHISIEEVYIRN